MTTNKIILAAIGAFAAAFLSFLAKHYWVRRERVSLQDDEKTMLSKELEDLERHLHASEITLRNMNGLSKRPSKIHFLKLMVREDSLLFAVETFRLLRPEKATKLNQLKLRIRNWNLESTSVAEYINLDTANATVAKEYVDYMVMKVEALREFILDRRRDLARPEEAAGLKMNDASNSPRPIIWVGEWPKAQAVADDQDF